MRSAFWPRLIPACTITAMLVAFSGLAGCAGGDTATVRINISLPSHEVAFKPDIADRILAFFTFSKALKADTPPAENPPIDTVRVTVSGSGMSAITVDGNPATGYIELEVPSGSARRFEVRAGYSYEGQVGETLYHWYYGNETVVDLAAGETKNLQPLMIGMAYEISASSGNGLNIQWNYYGSAPTDYIIQAGPSETGPFNTIYPGSGTLYLDPLGFDDVLSPISSGYVRVKPIIGTSSGLFSEPVVIAGGIF